jgi:hypothetical protein
MSLVLVSTQQLCGIGNQIFSPQNDAPKFPSTSFHLTCDAMTKPKNKMTRFDISQLPLAAARIMTFPGK